MGIEAHVQACNGDSRFPLGASWSLLASAQRFGLFLGYFTNPADVCSIRLFVTALTCVNLSCQCPLLPRGLHWLHPVGVRTFGRRLVLFGCLLAGVLVSAILQRRLLSILCLLCSCFRLGVGLLLLPYPLLLQAATPAEALMQKTGPDTAHGSRRDTAQRDGGCLLAQVDA